MRVRSVMARILRAVPCLLVAPVLSLAADVQHVTERDGNIYFTDGQQQREITSAGKDHDPSLSSDGALVVFVRQTGETVASDEPPQQKVSQLWVADTRGQKPPRLLFAGPVKIAHRTFGEFRYPQFAPHNEAVYFLITYGATTDGLVRFTLADKSLKLIGPALEYSVVTKGAFEGYVVLQQRRPYAGGGFYLWYWLFDSNGTDMGLIGPTKEHVIEFLSVWGGQ